MSKPTFASSTAEGTRLGTLFSTGGGVGSYTVASQANFTILDPANLNAGQNLLIPKGFCAIVSAGGSVGTLVAAAQASVGLFVDGVLVVEQDITGPGIAAPATFSNYSNFGLNWLVPGDGQVHNISLGLRTAVAADAVSVLNTTASNAPYLMVEITQNSFLGVASFGSSESEAQVGTSFTTFAGKLGAQMVLGSGAGNYSSTTSAFQPVDGGGGQLTIKTIVPNGFSLLIAAGGVIGSTGGTAVAAGLLVDGVLKTEQDITPHGTTQLSPFGLSYVVQGDGLVHSVAIGYRGNGAGGNVTLGNNSATHAPFILAELTQSNVGVGQRATMASSQSEGGNLGVYFLSGPGTGNYATNSQSYVLVDSAFLSKTIVVPLGYVAMVSANGVIGSLTAAVPVFAGILVDGILKAESVSTGAAAGNLVGFDVQYMLVGDGNAHTFAMAFHTTATADNAVIGNSSASHTPSLLIELTQSSVN